MSTASTSWIRYDRRLSVPFLEHLAPGGLLASLAVYSKSGLFPLDLRFRKDVKSGAEHVSLYVGLTSVLDVHHAKSGKLKLEVHKTHQKNGKFDTGWSRPRTPDELAAIWPDVELYLDRIIPIAAQSHGKKEGAVQAAVAAHRSRGRVVLDREVTPSFHDTPCKKQYMEECQRPILDALTEADLGFGKVPDKLGNECDALVIDEAGRLLAVEVKPSGAGTIAWVVAQAVMYARILQGWVDKDDITPDDPHQVLTCMLAQRYIARLAPPLDVSLPESLRVTPVVALQRGASPEMVRRMIAVRDVLAAVDLGVESVEIYEVNLIGEWIPLDESRLPDGQPVARRDYARESNERAIRWKLNTPNLPDEARAPGAVRGWGGTFEVDYALPAAYATYNLLPEVRQQALDLFEQHRIVWHQGIDGGPTNHLRSSQVQCVNALGQMMSDPERIKKAFGHVLDIAEVRDFGEIDQDESGRYLTFEFVGKHDYFGEGKGGALTRGSQSTSVDAAFAYRTSDGRDGLALVEWKFTETYLAADRAAAKKEASRRMRYEKALLQPGGPVLMDGVDLADLFHEPIYQLVRQQLLASALERDPAVRADVVSVVHVLSPDNTAYQQSFISPALRSHGATTSEVWSSLLRSPDRFVSLDPVVFLDPGVTSKEYVLRYGGNTA